MTIIESTSTTLLVELTPTIRLHGKRHSDRRTGSSVWETWFTKYGKYEVHNNPFDKNDYRIVEKWGKVKASNFRGVTLAKKWSYKKDIMDVLNSIDNNTNE